MSEVADWIPGGLHAGLYVCVCVCKVTGGAKPYLMLCVATFKIHKANRLQAPLLHVLGCFCAALFSSFLQL